MNQLEQLLVTLSVLVLLGTVASVVIARVREVRSQSRLSDALSEISRRADELHHEIATNRYVIERDAPSVPVAPTSALKPLGGEGVFVAPVVSIWDHATKDPHLRKSYRDTIGPVLDDLMIHAAKDGLIGEDDFDAFAEWTRSTARMRRPSSPGAAGSRVVTRSDRDLMWFEFPSDASDSQHA